ncbi:unnamed protein product [Absidia cylindrospora]
MCRRNANDDDLHTPRSSMINQTVIDPGFYFFTVSDEWRQFLTMNILLNLQIPESLTKGAPLPHIGNHWKCGMEAEASRGSDSDFQHCNKNAYSTWITATYKRRPNVPRIIVANTPIHFHDLSITRDHVQFILISLWQKKRATCSSNKDANLLIRCQYYRWCYYGTVEAIIILISNMDIKTPELAISHLADRMN